MWRIWYLCEHLPHVPVGDAIALRPPACLGVPELVHQTHLTREQCCGSIKILESM
jgi:hypothetical protein